MVCAITIYNKAYSGQYTEKFNFYMATIAPSIWLDAVPIFLVIWMHHRNFKNNYLASNRYSIESEDDINSTLSNLD